MRDFFRGVMEERFWRNWRRRLDRSSGVYINPDRNEVVEKADELGIDENKPDIEIAHEIWDYIRNNYEYNLNSRWRRPEELMEDGVGDCEDYCFLMASLLPNFGVYNFDLIAGEASTDHETDYHVWMKIDGEIVDPTAKPRQVPKIEYDPELIFEVEKG